ncbi:MAG: T9SS type A sorting domain-containing protein [Bacteroidota bacterium]
MLTSFAMTQNLSIRKEVSCTGEKRAAQEVLSSNKVLFVVSITSNCINCGEFLSTLSSFSNMQSSKVTVWAAMNKLVGTTNCDEIENFKDRYDLNNVFCFIDTNDVWTDGRFTFYTVIDPQGGLVAYQGTSYQLAITKALEIANKLPLSTTIDSKNPNNTSQPSYNKINISSVFPNPIKDELKYSISATDTTETTIKVLDLLGNEKVNITKPLLPEMNTYTIDLKEYKLERGIYFVKIEADKNIKTFRIIKN